MNDYCNFACCVLLILCFDTVFWAKCLYRSAFMLFASSGIQHKLIDITVYYKVRKEYTRLTKHSAICEQPRASCCLLR
jgi:hypothetical protein